VSEFDGELPPEALRAPGLRVEHRNGRLVVRSGPPRLLVPVVVAGYPVAILLLMTLRGSGRWEAEATLVLFMSVAFVAFAVFAWLVGGPWTLTLDRREGLTSLRQGPWRRRRPLSGLVGVRFFSARQAQIESVRRRRSVMPYALCSDDNGCSVALVDTYGRSWLVTRTQDDGWKPRREDAEQAARLVATYLGIPLLPLYWTPPSGTVPPPLEEGAPL